MEGHMLGEEMNHWSAAAIIIVTLINSVITWLTRRETEKAKMHAQQANEAINQRPPGSPKAYDLIQSTRDETIRVQTMLEDHIHHHDTLDEKVERMDKRLDRVESKLLNMPFSNDIDQK